MSEQFVFLLVTRKAPTTQEEIYTKDKKTDTFSGGNEGDATGAH